MAEADGIAAGPVDAPPQENYFVKLKKLYGRVAPVLLNYYSEMSSYLLPIINSAASHQQFDSLKNTLRFLSQIMNRIEMNHINVFLRWYYEDNELTRHALYISCSLVILGLILDPTLVVYFALLLLSPKIDSKIFSLSNNQPTAIKATATENFAYTSIVVAIVAIFAVAPAYLPYRLIGFYVLPIPLCEIMFAAYSYAVAQKILNVHQYIHITRSTQKWLIFSMFLRFWTVPFVTLLPFGYVRSFWWLLVVPPIFLCTFIPHNQQYRNAHVITSGAATLLFVLLILLLSHWKYSLFPMLWSFTELICVSLIGLVVDKSSKLRELSAWLLYRMRVFKPHCALLCVVFGLLFSSSYTTRMVWFRTAIFMSPFLSMQYSTHVARNRPVHDNIQVDIVISAIISIGTIGILNILSCMPVTLIFKDLLSWIAQWWIHEGGLELILGASNGLDHLIQFKVPDNLAGRPDVLVVYENVGLMHVGAVQGRENGTPADSISCLLHFPKPAAIGDQAGAPTVVTINSKEIFSFYLLPYIDNSIEPINGIVADQ